jgi:hypothetical protein
VVLDLVAGVSLAKRSDNRGQGNPARVRASLEVPRDTAPTDRVIIKVVFGQDETGGHATLCERARKISHRRAGGIGQEARHGVTSPRANVRR